MRKKAILFRSNRRFDNFYTQLENNNFDIKILDFGNYEWINYDYSDCHLIIYFPDFAFSSNNPQALTHVQDNLKYIHSRFPKCCMFPDPAVIDYYSDKYMQYLFLSTSNLSVIPTLPLLSENNIDEISDTFGFPLVVKNRFGAGGSYVFLVKNKKELMSYLMMSRMNFIDSFSPGRLINSLFNREYWWSLLKAKKMNYPFLSYPLIVQKFISHDRDLKVVAGFNRIVEAHWRHKANQEMWKMNIDGGGVGVWSRVPEEAIKLSLMLTKKLNAHWLNIDLIFNDEQFYISEFSPVWHHYAYKEKDSFIYKDDYNIEMPLEKSLNLEEMIVESFSAYLTQTS